MDLARMIEAMQSAQIPADEILIVVKAYASKRDAERKERNRQRVAKCRENKSINYKEPVMDVMHVTVTDVTSPNGFPDPSLTPKENPPKGGQKKGPEEFEQFWQAYPADRRKEKPKAAEAWRGAIKLSTAAEILSSLSRYCRTREAREGFAPYPAKWLKNQRWLEDHEAEPLKKAHISQLPRSAPTGQVSDADYQFAKKMVKSGFNPTQYQAVIDRYEKQHAHVAH